MDNATRCFACRGVYHPATGHLFRPDVAYCGPCARTAFAWVGSHTKPRRRKSSKSRSWRDHDFYEAAATSIRAGGGNCPGCGYPPVTLGGACLECQADDAALCREANERLDTVAITADEQIRKVA
jgi:hypothetical protein